MPINKLRIHDVESKKFKTESTKYKYVKDWKQKLGHNQIG